jgi:Domain of unknown function (DUF4785)
MRLTLSLALATALASFTATAAQPLLPAGSRDQTPQRLAALPAPAGQFERAPVSFSWKLDPQQALAAPAPHTAQSREYWQTVDGASLQQGLELQLSAPGSLIRVSPARGAAGLSADALRVDAPGRGAVKLQRMLSDRQLQAAGMDVQRGTVMAKLGNDVGAGRYMLRAQQAKGQYVVHVFEPGSDTVLRAGTDRDRALAGETLRLDVAMNAGSRALKPQAEALLVAPDGRTWPVALAASGNGLGAQVKLPAVASNAPGLWELQVFADAGGVQRDARTAFAVAQPTARFGGSLDFNIQALRVDLPVQAGSEGRYEARGTLYATGPDGTLRPVSQAASAAWMRPGKASLRLQFERSHLPQGYGAPFEVRQLELHDQTRMAPLETRERAARIAPDDRAPVTRNVRRR